MSPTCRRIRRGSSPSATPCWHSRGAGYGDIELPIFEDTRAVRPRRGVHRRGVRGDVHLRRPRPCSVDAAPRRAPPGDARGYRAYGLDRGALPVKLCYAGPFFRYERPQAGCYRQLQQVGHRGDRCRRPGAGRRGDHRSPTAASAPWGSTASGWRSPRWATTPAARSTGNCCRSSCSVSTSTRTSAGAPLNPAAGARRQAPAHARTHRRRPRHARPPLRRRQGTLRPCWRTWTPSGCPCDQPADGARTGLLGTRPLSEFVHDGLGAQSGDRRRRTLRRVDAVAGNPGPLRHRVRPRGRPHHAGAARRGQDGGRHHPLRGLRGAARRAGQTRTGCWPAALRAAGGLDLAYGDRAKGRCAPPTAPGPGSPWWPATVTSRAGTVGVGISPPGSRSTRRGRRGARRGPRAVAGAGSLAGGATDGELSEFSTDSWLLRFAEPGTGRARHTFLCA